MIILQYDYLIIIMKSVMQGQPTFKNHLSLINMNDFVPFNHFLRKVDRILELSFVRDMTADSYKLGKGRPSIDPEIFFRIVLVGYFYNISSDRQLVEEINCNLAYRLFRKIALDQKVPDHSSLTRIRDRFGLKTIKKFFVSIIKICESRGLVTGKSLMVDATLMNANAAVSSLKVREGTCLDEKSSKRITNKTHISVTDPDASLAYKAGAAQSLKYKAHLILDRAHRIIVDCHMTTGCEHESQSYLQRLSNIDQQFDWKIEDVTADRAYGSAINLQAIKDKGWQSYIPLFNRDTGTNVPEDFTYDELLNHYICPLGKYLKLNSSQTAQALTYRAKKSECQVCSIKDNCLSTTKQSMKVLRPHFHHKLLQETQRRMKTPSFIAVMKERFWKIENIIAEAKNCHGLKKARYRGLSKAQIQAYFVASAQNIKRMVAAILLSNL